MNALIFGATAGLGKALAEALAQHGFAVVLVGRDGDDLNRVAADLESRWQTDVTAIRVDARDYDAVTAAFKAVVAERRIDVALFPVGVSVDDDIIGADPSVGRDLVATNLLSVMAATSVLATTMRDQGGGAMVGFSSVAATRGRARNAAYAAAKRGLESWFESLRADLADSGVVVRWYVLGYLDTNLAYGKPLPLPSASPSQLANRVVAELQSAGGARYAPRWWRPLAFVTRRVPFAIFKRMKV